jgi:hypothetical protein
MMNALCSLIFFMNFIKRLHRDFYANYTTVEFIGADDFAHSDRIPTPLRLRVCA